ncbi:MAG: TonB-dependent receptor [Saprospiraceae bacterium]|nr:MAG: TonB-dependent receptor [Saprospiraceae bacterium]
MKSQLYFCFTFFLAVLCQPAFAQSGKVSGKITDKTNNEPLIGATVLVLETGSGTVAGLDGSYELQLTPGSHTLEISYAGYQTEKVTGLQIKESDNIKLDFALGSGTSILETIVVTATAKRNSYSNLMLLQQKSVSIVTGISAEQMKLSPDRTTGDVLKRVSGASVQDNKYVVIRGLAGRYNAALINGLSLPGTEPDKRAFSFDIFPANLLDNLIIYKTATPDLPGEFAGGVIQLNTKEIPQESFSSLSLSLGYNSQSTFKNFQSYRGGSKDWLGYDDGTRALPSALENVGRDTFNSNQVKSAQAFPNDWAITNEASMRPSLGLQFSAGKSFGRLGVVGALTYGNSPKIETGERGDFNVDGSRLFQYFDHVYKNSVSVGGLFNMAYKLSNRSKLQFNNTYTVSADDQLGDRMGDNLEQTRIENSNSFYYAGNSLYTSQVIGGHAFTRRQIKLGWALGYNRITRDIPSYRRMLYTQNFGTPEEENPFVAAVPFGNPSPNFAGNFYAKQSENFYTGKLDLTVPFLLNAKKGSFKMGGLWEDKNREFNARLFGFISTLQTPQELFLLPIGEIFAPENIGQQGFKMKETTDRSDSYTAGSVLMAGYGMLEQSLTDRLRFTGGVRVESFNQTLNSFKILSTTPVKLDTTLVDVLPSAHLIYALSDSTNLRASVAKTVARPNFRELAPFSFFDFFMFAGVNGNPALERTKIWNADLRFETYRRGGQYFAVSVFYKHFNNPIEQVFNNAAGAGTRNFQWQNVPSAYDLGGEVEGRIKLGRLAGFLKDFTVFGNLSYIFSKVDVSQIPGALERPLFGQSPYLVNAGLNYDNPEFGFSSSLLFNRIGRRVWLVGQDQYLHTYEAPRSVVDFQLTKKLNRFGELKLTIGDLLNQEAVFYQDYNDNGRYDAVSDKKIAGQRFGANVSLGFSYSLSGE